jgi:DNA polymerase elongation subunit (family B)
MTQAITKKNELMGILTYSGIKFFFPKTAIKNVLEVMKAKDDLILEDNFIPYKDIRGIYEQEYIEQMEEIEERKNESSEGAFVYEPVPGIYENIALQKAQL